MPTNPPRKFRLPLSAPFDPSHRPMPAALRAAISRGVSGRAGESATLVDGVTVLASYELTGASRSAEAPASVSEDLGQALLALEADDGTTLFIRADRLRDDLARLYPEALSADGDLDLALLRERDTQSRGGLGAWLWKRLSILKLDADAMADEARARAIDWLGGELVAELGEQAIYAASWQGAKALMQAVEARLAGQPGLYQWAGGLLTENDRCRKDDARFGGWPQQPGLVFIHGTGSTTLGSFGDLAGSDDWRSLQRTFGERVFGFEHRSFSESPIDNALALLDLLPDQARLCLVTHSRGGLVGDLLCLGNFTAENRTLIGDYRRMPRPDEEDAENQHPALRALREKVAAEEQAKLRTLVDRLEQKSLRIERYVRVACPAAGTALLSDNLEVFLSGLLALVRKLGAWGAGATVGALATPLAGQAAAGAADQLLKLLGRVVLEIADKRLQPQCVPGIEAMLPEAPIGAFLARAPRRPGIRMAVIAGDSEGGGMLRRIGVMFTDWMLFDRADNDLVVDTASMIMGLAAGNGAHALFDQGDTVSHFSYFRNPRTRAAVHDWLLDETPAANPCWSELPLPRRETREAVRATTMRSRGAAEAPADNTRPVVIYLPGIMGSHLEVRRRQPQVAGSGDRIWLDLLDLPRGGLRKIARNAKNVRPEDLVDLAYGDLARHLEASHRVIRFPYDWRLDIAGAATRLAEVLRQALDAHPDQPVRLLAHSMGGLVARAMIAAQPTLWEELVKRPGGRLLLLGTPNHGSHLMVETLLGKSPLIRLLGAIDLVNRLPGVLDLVAAFPGALQLLPQPGFTDTAGIAANDYFAADTWSALAQHNSDFWFGSTLGARPAATDLRQARAFWQTVGDLQGAAKAIEPTDRVALIVGQADNTPCGIRVGEKRIEMLGTAHGDGYVTWASARLDWLPNERCWTMPVDHLGLTSTHRYFDDIVELLSSGSSSHLPRLPVSRGTGSAPVGTYQPGPTPGFPSEAGLVAALIGGHPRSPRPHAVRRTLAVGVKAMDLRFLQHPILCGHYLGDPISGPEAAIDQTLVKGTLSQRQRLGVHAGALGSTSVVLMPRGREDLLRGTWRGAVVVGLGEMGQLSSREISETVRTGVLRLLLHADDRCLSAALPDATVPGEQRSPDLTLASLLIGYNSTTNISLDESVKAVTLGVLEANHQFAQGQPARSGGSRRREAARPPLQVARLEFVELFRDAAITAAYAVRQLPTTLAQELKRLETGIEPAVELSLGQGVRRRLSLTPSSSYWPRLMVSDAGNDSATSAPAGGPSPVPAAGHAQRLKFVYLGQQARAEAIVQQGQPGLVDSLVRDVVRSPRYTPGNGIGNTLFQLLVPLDFKAAAREASNLLLAVDGASANIPWEMLEADGQPLVLATRLIRQLVSARYRQHAQATRKLSALLLVNPSTRGYHGQFGGADWRPRVKPNGEVEEDRLVSLPGSEAEAQVVRAVLERNGYQITEAPPDAEAGDVFGKLFAAPYRLLIVSAHGVHQVQARDGSWRSGVVLSDGMLLSAAEVGLMEVVPELVFLNCCHLGKIDASDSAAAGAHRLAYSLARELIEMGARCVVASGWEVDDAAGRTFAETFFNELATHAAPFAAALHEARRQTYALHPGINTWGAFQAYGDPDYRLEIRDWQDDDDQRLLAPDELLDWLERRRLDALQPAPENAEQRLRELERALKRRLRQVPTAWLDRPDIQQALGLLYAEHGAPGFDQSRAALCRAVAGDARMGVVALSSIEQLANVESRQAERLGRDERTRQAALALVDTAITRVRELIHIASPAPGSGAAATLTAPSNSERQSLLGSALKRKASLLIAAGASWADARPVLADARDAYRAGQSRPDATDFNPYAMINRLQLDALLGDREPALDALIEQCQAAARRRFAEDYDFFDGVMAVDAELARLLDATADVEPLRGIASRYLDAVEPLSTSARQFNSVGAQLALLASFVQARGASNDTLRAQALAAIAEQLEPRQPAMPD